MTTSASSRIDWVLFILLGFFWGSSYLFIKIGVDEGLSPFMLITLRLFIGFALLATVVTVARESLPRSPRIYGHLIVMGAVNIAIPFSLITWAELTVDSALAAILTAPVPLFVIVIAAIFLRDERITINRLAGLVVGFVGVAILVGFDPASLAAGDLAGEIALLGATLSYACGAVYARRNIRGLRPMIPALFQVAFALMMVSILTLVFEQPFSTRDHAGGVVLGDLARAPRIRARLPPVLPAPRPMGRDPDVDGRVPAARLRDHAGCPRPERTDRRSAADRDGLGHRRYRPGELEVRSQAAVRRDRATVEPAEPH